jgi:hypothetical protein
MMFMPVPPLVAHDCRHDKTNAVKKRIARRRDSCRLARLEGGDARERFLSFCLFLFLGAGLFGWNPQISTRRLSAKACGDKSRPGDLAASGFRRLSSLFADWPRGASDG